MRNCDGWWRKVEEVAFGGVVVGGDFVNDALFSKVRETFRSSEGRTTVIIRLSTESPFVWCEDYPLHSGGDVVSSSHESRADVV